MLGMMNCPTDSVEFYSASPSMKRSIEEHASTCEKLHRADAPTNSKAAGNAGKANSADSLSCSDSDSDVVRVFSEARDKPHFTYTSDGRKLVDGKEENNSTAMRDPLKLWDRLILSSIVATKMEPENRRRSSDITNTRSFLDVSCVKPRSESVNVIAQATVHSANLSLKQTLTKKRSGSAPKLPTTSE